MSSAKRKEIGLQIITKNEKNMPEYKLFAQRVCWTRGDYEPISKPERNNPAVNVHTYAI